MAMAKPTPNVLWLFSDGLRYHALSCNGDPNIQTPHLDRLAAEGVRFTEAFSHYPVCMPMRAGLVTGQYAHINGLRVHGDLLPPGSHTVAHSFRAAGYRSSWVGKWHLAGEHGLNMLGRGWQGEDFWVDPQLRGGFEDWYGFNLSNHYYRTIYSHGDDVMPHILDGYQTDALTDLSLQYLEDTARGLDAPWFHVLSVEAPHGGVGADGKTGNPAPPEYEARFEPDQLELRQNVPAVTEQRARTKLAGYYAQIANLDDNVGRVLAWLDDTGLAQNTMVVFFSDHGNMAGSLGGFGKSLPLEESLHVPVIARLPGSLDGGRTYDGLFSTLDLFATCAGMCGVPVPPSQQGHDHTVALRDRGRPPRNEVLVQWLGVTRFKGSGDHPYRAIRTERYTYCVGRDEEFCLLLDHDRDPFEQANLWAKASARPLREQLHRHLCTAVLGSGEALPDFVRDRQP